MSDTSSVARSKYSGADIAEIEATLAKMFDPHAGDLTFADGVKKISTQYPELWGKANEECDKLYNLRKKLPHAAFVSTDPQ